MTEILQRNPVSGCRFLIQGAIALLFSRERSLIWQVHEKETGFQLTFLVGSDRDCIKKPGFWLSVSGSHCIPNGEVSIWVNLGDRQKYILKKVATFRYSG